MYMSYPFGRLNLKTTILVPMLILSMFTFIPLVQSRAVPEISKFTPAVLEQMSSASESVDVIIQTLSEDYSALVSQINDLGGKIGHLFKYVNALSASVPKNKMIELSANRNIEKIYYDAPRQLTAESGASLDLMRSIPTVAEAEGIEAIELTPEMLNNMGTENAYNSIAMGAQPIWPTTNYGAGSLVAVIDTGIWTSNIFFTYTSIVGGVDLSADVGNPTYEGWNKQTNYFHGGHVAGIIAANIALAISPTSGLYRYVLAVERYSGLTFPVVGGRKIMPVPGMAPLASLYIIKVFDHTGGATSTSYIMAGMEWAMDLRTNGTDVDVVNMSLGGADLFDGRDPEDQLVDLMTSTGITVCASAGNNGPATMTAGARPGGANTAIASGAADHPVETRSFWDYYYNAPGIGYYLYRSNNVQIDSLTSRGPTADGRVKPDISATGVFVLSAYTASAGGVAWASGTSMASPATAGAVALLNAWAEINGKPASPEDYKQAIKGGAVSLPGWTQYDQGAGYLNAANSLTVLMNDASYGDVATPLPPAPPLTDISNIPIVGSGTYTTSFSGLAPGWKNEYIFKALPTTNHIMVKISGVNLGSDPLGGANSLVVHIESAKRTTNGYYAHYSYVVGDAWFSITTGTTQYHGAVIGGLGDFDAATRLTRIEPGYVKVVIENDWISYDNAAATVEIKVTEQPLETPDLYLSGTIADGQSIGWLAVPIKGKPTSATIELWWGHDWAAFPTSDIDLIVYWDAGYNFDGATINSPERVKLDNPTFIYLLIDGYAIYSGTDTFTLKIYFGK